MTRVSIIIPAYNAERFIEAALASAAGQTERDLEILVVDDCSTDATADRVKAAARIDPRIRLVGATRNGGPSAARNLGLQVATGEWIALLDADDSMTSDRIESLVAMGEVRRADIVSDNILLIDETGAAAPVAMIPPAWLPAEQRLEIAEFIARNVGDPKYPRVSYGFMKPLIRRDFLERHALRYDESVRFAEDFALYVRCLRADAVWWVTPRALYHYLVRANSLTEVQTSADLDHLRSAQRSMLQDPAVQANRDLRHAVRRHLAVIDRNYYYRAFTDAMKANDLRIASTLLVSRGDAPVMIARESLRQLPTLVAKALRGGYRRRSNL